MPELNWVNRNQAEQTAESVPYHLLKFEQAYGDETMARNNLIIQGDNLQALKALLPLYGGQVKCIFIDPPYNSQKAFEKYDDKLEHSQWISMLYPRLQLLADFLCEKGTIWITLSEAESHYAKVICDEIFGRKNYIGTLIWKKRKGGGNDSHFFAIDHDYVLVYGKNADKKIHEKWKIPQSENYLKRYKFTDENGERYYWDTLARDGLQNPIKIEITCPDGEILNFNSQKPLKKITEGLENGQVKFTRGKNGWVLHHRVYMPKDGQVLRSILDDVGTNKDAADEMEALFGDKNAFDYPKPESLIKKIIELNTQPNDLILDSFLGSGTTAAVAHKMKRRYIGIEMGEQAQTLVIPRLKQVINGEQGGISTTKEYFDLKDDALMDLELDIADIKTFNKVLGKIGKETDLIDKGTLKLLKQISKTEKIKSDSIWQGGGGFSFYTLGSPVFEEHGFLNPNVKFADLASYVWWLDTKTAYPTNQAPTTPLLGVHDGVAYYLLYNGILGDRRPNGGNVLTMPVLRYLEETFPHPLGNDGKRVIFGEASRINQNRLDTLNIEFKQIPYALYGTQSK